MGVLLGVGWVGYKVGVICSKCLEIVISMLYLRNRPFLGVNPKSWRDLEKPTLDRQTARWTERPQGVLFFHNETRHAVDATRRQPRVPAGSVA